MAKSVQNINSQIKAGTCPHGLAPGACPICSNMGGGGGSLRAGERPQKAGEMSYHQCAMIGAMMKARALREQVHEQNIQARAEAIIAFQQNLEKLAGKMLQFATQISNNFILKPVAITINNIVVPLIKMVKNIPNIITNINNRINQIKQQFVDIQDKLNAIFGEAKAFVEKKVSELVINIKSKFEGLLKVLKRENTKDEDTTKLDEDKKIFNLKTVLHKIFKRKKRNDTKDKSRS